MIRFEYYRPKSLEEVWELKEKIPGARFIAGGTDVMVGIRNGEISPPALISLRSLPGLDNIEVGETTHIGSLTTIRDLIHHPSIVDKFPILVEAAKELGSLQIRNMATLAGNICNASPGADTPPILLALDAEVEICALNGGVEVQQSRVPIGGFFVGPKKTVLKQGQMVHSVSVPLPPEHSGSAFRRLARVSLDIAKINCAAFIKREGDRVETARVALGSVAPTPLRAPSIEGALEGQKYGERLFQEAAELVKADITPIDDVRSTAEYRSQIASLLVREALQEAWRRSGGKG